MNTIPKTFPRRTLLGSLPGAAPKLSVRLTSDGTYTNLSSDYEYLQAYENAEGLAQQLRDYALRKERENPNWTREFNLNRIKNALDAKFRAGKWDVVSAEQEWIMRRLVELLA